MKTVHFSRAAIALLMMLLTTATAWATIKTVTYTYTDGQTLGGGKIRMTFTATGDISATYTVDVIEGEHSASFTLGDLHVSWESPETYFSVGNLGGWRMGGTAGYPDWTFTISSDNYYIDNVKYYNVYNELRMEKANDTKSCAITADNVAFGGTAFGIHAFTVVMSDSPAYAIHYELNGGYASGNANPAYYETTTGLTLTDATREFYNFGGWYDNAGLTGSAVTSIPAGTTGERTLYAKWTPVIYTISYVLNEGTNPSNACTSYTIETPTFNLPTPTRSNYYFRGWYLNEDFASAQYTQIEKGRYHCDFTFYAKWEKWAEEGDGTKWNPYKITNEAQLRALATQVNGGDDCEGKYYQQTCDITITGGDWTPIGTSDNKFRGNYDGGNYTISGINISSTSSNQGLFGYVNGSTTNDIHMAFIQNVILENSTIVGKSSTGGIVGYLSYGHVQNCHVRSNVTVQAGVDGNSTANLNRGFGGVVGYAVNANTITSCTSMATVNKGEHSNVNGFGGVIGFMKVSPASAINCFSYGMKAIGESVGTPTNVEQVYKIRCTDGSITLPESVSDTDGFYYDGIGYYKKGVAVPLTVTLGEPAPGYALSVSYNDGSDHAIAPNADGEYLYTTTASDVTVKASIIPDPVHFSQSGDEYTIYTAEGWGVFCDALQDNATYNRFSGKTVKLGNDIEVSRMAGSQNHDFCGTFDGCNNTLTFTSTENNDRVAPFSYISNVGSVAAVIRRLNVVANINSSGQCASALVGEAWGVLTIEHCTVSGTITTSKQFAGGIIGSVSNSPLNITDCRSSVTINSSVEGDGSHGGFAGRVPSSATLNISGCVFDGKIVTTTNGTKNCGGFVGHSENQAGNNVSIANSLYAPAIADGETEVLTGDVNDPSCTFARNVIAENITNCYYTRLLGTAQGKATRTVTAGTNVTIEAVSPVGSPVENGTYSVSGITAYANGGITRTVGQTTTFYYGSEDQVSLTLSHSPAPTGVTFYAYTASGGTLNGTKNPYTLTMPDADVTIGATWSTSYIDENGHEQSHAVTLLTGSENTLAAGTYVAQGNLHYTSGITLSGDVNLILADGCQMNFGTSDSPISNIGIGGSCDLTIYGQSAGNGALSIYTSGDGIHGISANNITINGGNVTANAEGGTALTTVNNTIHGKISIHGGRVDATGVYGIVGTRSVFIYGGKVNATGSTQGIYASYGGIKLGWTNYDDHITASSYYVTYYISIKVDSGKKFIDGSGNIYTDATSSDTFKALKNTTLYPYVENLDLAANADNTARIAAAATLYAPLDVTLQGRTLYKDGDWNTLCLPFSLTAAQVATVLENPTKLMTLNGTTSDLTDGTLTLNFTDATTIGAGVPYIIKWDKATGYDDADPDTRDLKDPVFTGVTIDKTMHDVEFTGGSFKGTYAPIEYPTENTSILLLGTNSTLYWPKPGTDPDTGNPVYPRIGACRAYFDLTDGNAGVREFKLNFGDGNGSADVSSAIIADGDVRAPRGWYTLDGRKLNKRPTKPGLYINNGHKVVIK